MRSSARAEAESRRTLTEAVAQKLETREHVLIGLKSLPARPKWATLPAHGEDSGCDNRLACRMRQWIFKFITIFLQQQNHLQPSSRNADQPGPRPFHRCRQAPMKNRWMQRAHNGWFVPGLSTYSAESIADK